jgi:uncharacterized protein
MLLGFAILGLASACAAADQAYMKDFEVCGYGKVRPGAAFPGNRGMQEPVDLYCTGAAHLTGLNMGTGQRMQQNPALGARYVLRAAEAGYVPAQAAAGVLYAGGTGVPQNFAEAAKWYRKAAENGHVQAASNLALLYYRGQGVPRDLNESRKWNEFAAGRGSALAEDNLYWQQRGPQPRPPDPEDYDRAVQLWMAKDKAGSFALFLKSAQAGNWYAQTAVGLDYEFGDGVQPNMAQAIAWYTKAASSGFRVAQSCLGNLYSAGKGIARNDAEALKWYQKAADQRDPNGYYGLARAYEYGFGVKQDRRAAIQYYEKAGARGLPEGTSMAEYLKDPNHPDIPSDASWYGSAAPSGGGHNTLEVLAANDRRSAQERLQLETMRQRDQGLICAMCSANRPH